MTEDELYLFRLHARLTNLEAVVADFAAKSVLLSPTPRETAERIQASVLKRIDATTLPTDHPVQSDMLMQTVREDALQFLALFRSSLPPGIVIEEPT